MEMKFLTGNGADLSKNHFIKNAKHVYLEPNNLYSLRNFFDPESLNFIYSNGLINETKFSRILIKEMLVYCKVGGKILINFKDNRISNYGKLLSEIKNCIHDKAKIIYSKKGKQNIILLEKVKPFLKKEDSIDKWSFGIITNGQKNDWVEKQIKSIKEQKIPNFEIIVCGTYFNRKEKNFKYIPFSEKDNLGWITKKKNLICENARYENLCIIHDRIIFEKNWFKGIKKYGNFFEILSCIIKNEEGDRCGDWITSGNYLGKFSKIGMLDYKDNQRFGYLDGAAYIFKKNVWKKIRWNENLFWNQGEDIDLSQRLYQNGFVMRFNPFSSCITLSWRHGNFLIYKFNKVKDSQFPWDLNLFKNIIKFYLKKIINWIK